MPVIKAGAEIANPDTGYVGLARRDVPVEVIEYLGDDEGGPYLVRIKRREWAVDGSDLAYTPAEYAALFGDELADEERRRELVAVGDGPDDYDYPF